MSIRNLDALFRPASVALVGASARPGTLGAVLAHNLMSGGFAGPVMPVNAKGGAIASTIAYPSVSDLPRVPELAVIATPPETVPGLIGELGARGCRGAVVITAGFGELGAEGGRLQSALLQEARRTLLRVIGPNCLGILVPGMGLNASFAPGHARKGDIAFLAQSGAIITAVLDWANERGIGFSHLVSLGAMSDVDFGDMLDYLAHDPEVRAVLLYIEAVTHARKFMSAARAAARLKPVIVMKAGRHPEGAKAAKSHTGALAGADEVYDAAIRRAGMLRVKAVEELFAAVETLSHPQPFKGDRLAILTNGGGLGVIATDALMDAGGRLAPLHPDTIARLDAALPRTWSHGNPVDIIGDAPGARYAAALEALMADPGVDAVLVLNCPTAVADSLDAARAVAATAEDAKRRDHVGLFTAWLGGKAVAAARDHCAEAGIPAFETPGEAVQAFMHRVAHARNQALLLEAPPAPPQMPEPARKAARGLIEAALGREESWLSSDDAKAVLSAYGIPVVETVRAPTPGEAAAKAEEVGLPAALKILSPDIPHKSDVGGVALGLKDARAVREAAEAMLARIAKAQPEARLEGFTVQPMVARPGAHELICGLAQDPLFGPVLLFGQGGTAVEVVGDKAIALPPLNDALARDLVARTRVSRLLAGYRDRPPADMEAVVAVILRLGEMAADLPEIEELDINPLFADDAGVLALDARIRIAHAKGPPGSNFAIRPYPVSLERRIETRSGARFFLRPIRPDDAGRLEAHVSACAPEDIRMRFLGALKRLPPQLALRLTQIDYAREMAFVATADGEPEHVAAVVRLSADPDGERAEFAVLVRSDLKGQGLGYRLMEEIVAYAKSIGIKEVFGDALAENTAMLTMAGELGFALERKAEAAGIVEMTLRL